MLCNSIFSLFLIRILVVVFSRLSKQLYRHGSSDVKFYIATFQKKNMILKRHFRTRYPDATLLKLLRYWKKEKNGE